jgi:hypothetical protein
MKIYIYEMHFKQTKNLSKIEFYIKEISRKVSKISFLFPFRRKLQTRCSPLNPFSELVNAEKRSWQSDKVDNCRIVL